MKNLIKISVFMLALVMILSGCGQSAPEATPTPTPVADENGYTFDSVIEVDSPIVGQWVPVGIPDPESGGYMQFTSDGKIVQFQLGSKGEMNYNEVRYYLTSENTFRMIRSDNTTSFDLKFEVINDGKTLNVYNTPGLNIASEFVRIDI